MEAVMVRGIAVDRGRQRRRAVETKDMKQLMLYEVRQGRDEGQEEDKSECSKQSGGRG